MPRQPRKHSESGFYHIVLRGINRQNIFEDDRDYHKFIDILELVRQLSAFELDAYCLMSNHVHLLIRIKEEPLEQVLKRIGVRYVGWYNDKYARCGPLFQDRFKSEGIDDERYLLVVLKYIHQNPIKAGLCENVEEYRWTSYRDYLTGSGVTDTAEVLAMLSDNEKNAINQFKKLIREPVQEACIDFNTEKRLYTDADVKKIINEQCGAESIADFQRLEAKERKEVISKLRKEGVSIRQISRLTGVSFGVIRGIKCT